MSISDISPGLTYDDAAKAIDWLCEAFGFRKRLVVPGEDGSIRHSELSLGNAAIMVSSARPGEGRLSPRSLKGLNQTLAVRVDDPDAHFLLARAAGAEILVEPQDEDYGSRGYMAKDLEGHQWYFGTYSPGTYWDKSED
ncbi:MAG: VOC family protein [Planctomycetota bacterium]|jgi:uncharacterized glyoxalase superfamily protein PhnB